MSEQARSAIIERLRTAADGYIGCTFEEDCRCIYCEAVGEIEALRGVLLAFSFHLTGLRTRDWDPIYTAVGSLTGEQQDVLRGVLNSGSPGETA